MRRIDIVAAQKRFGAVRALDGVDLTVHPGESLVVLGPSGSGKSTLLRVIAGLEELDGGQVSFDRESQAGVPAHRRDVSIVFQQFALYPHLSAHDNITLGLRHGLGLGRAEADRRAADVAERLAITELLGRRPRAMSGGQRQRVALGRALAREAGIVLLDEPLSGLDAQLRLTLRVEIADLLRSTGATVLHVTHDQLDAMAMADRIVVLRDGRIEQQGTPEELYDRPSTRFVAGFLGTPPMNFFPTAPIGDGCSGDATLRSLFGAHPGLRSPVTFAVRPDDLMLSSSCPWSASARVVAVELAGHDRVVHLSCAGQVLSARCSAAMAPRIGTTVPIGCDPRLVHVFSLPEDRRLGSAKEHLMGTAPVHTIDADPQLSGSR